MLCVIKSAVEKVQKYVRTKGWAAFEEKAHEKQTVSIN